MPALSSTVSTCIKFSEAARCACAGLGGLVDYSGENSQVADSSGSDGEEVARPKIVSFF